MAAESLLKLAVHVSSGDQFGCSTALDNMDFALIGARNDTVRSGAVGAGVAYWMRVRSNTVNASAVLLQVLRAPDAVPGSQFGAAVAIKDGYMVVGAPLQLIDPFYPNSVSPVSPPGVWRVAGAAYVWRYTTGPPSTYVRRLTSDAPTADYRFGSAVAINAGRVVVGESPESYPAGSPLPSHNGNVYIFNLTSGVLLAKLWPVDPVNGTQITGCFGFGAALAFTDGLLAVGSPRAKAPCAYGARWGAVWVFETTGWNQTAKILPARSEGALRSEFGFSIAWQRRSDGNGFSLLVGAPGLLDMGAVYTFGPFDNQNSSQHARVASEPWGAENASQTRPWAPRLLGDTVGAGRFGHSISIDSDSGVALASATTRFTAQGPNTGGVNLLRHWVVGGCETTAASQPTCTFGDCVLISDPNSPVNSRSSPPWPPASPPPPAAPPGLGCVRMPLPLSHVMPRPLWGTDTEDLDEFGTSVALNSNGLGLVGASKHAGTGALYLFVPPPFPTPPAMPPPPHSRPPPSPPPPMRPPSPPAQINDSVTMMSVGIAVGTVCSIGAVLVLMSIISVLRRARAAGARVQPPANGKHRRVQFSEERVEKQVQEPSPGILVVLPAAPGAEGAEVIDGVHVYIWRQYVDPASDKSYYVNAMGQTTWDLPDAGAKKPRAPARAEPAGAKKPRAPARAEPVRERAPPPPCSLLTPDLAKLPGASEILPKFEPFAEQADAQWEAFQAKRKAPRSRPGTAVVNPPLVSVPPRPTTAPSVCQSSPGGSSVRQRLRSTVVDFVQPPSAVIAYMQAKTERISRKPGTSRPISVKAPGEDAAVIDHFPQPPVGEGLDEAAAVIDHVPQAPVGEGVDEAAATGDRGNET